MTMFPALFTTQNKDPRVSESIFSKIGDSKGISLFNTVCLIFAKPFYFLHNLKSFFSIFNF